MAYSINEINQRACADPAAFIADCDAIYNSNISAAAERIISHRGISPIVLISGPSGSGKTTTAMKIAEALRGRGVRAHSIPLDNYFRTVTPEAAPRTVRGEIDYESPGCLDMGLLNSHFTMLSAGETVEIPRFDFSRQTQMLNSGTLLRLGGDEIAVFEGIHALNDDITSVHSEAFKVFISASTDVEDNGRVVFPSIWTRMVRRVVRDKVYRLVAVEKTLGIWENVLRGEQMYINPFAGRANLRFDTSLAYEIPVFARTALELFRSTPAFFELMEDAREVIRGLELFEGINQELVGQDSLLREFIGGSVYVY